MQLRYTTTMIASAFVAAATARIGMNVSASPATNNQIRSTGSIDQYWPESMSLATVNETALYEIQSMSEGENGLNITRRDAFDDLGGPSYIKECMHVHSGGPCFNHEIVPEGSCFPRKYLNFAKTWLPDRGVVCHMLDEQNPICDVSGSWIGFFTYPGTADSGNDPMWMFAQMIDANYLYCWKATFGDAIPRTEPHYWALPHGWRIPPWAQAPGVLPRGTIFDPNYTPPTPSGA